MLLSVCVSVCRSQLRLRRVKVTQSLVFSGGFFCSSSSLFPIMFTCIKFFAAGGITWAFTVTVCV